MFKYLLVNMYIYIYNIVDVCINYDIQTLCVENG